MLSEEFGLQELLKGNLLRVNTHTYLTYCTEEVNLRFSGADLNAYLGQLSKNG